LRYISQELAVKRRPPKQPVYKILHRQASVQEQKRQQRVAETRAAEMRVRQEMLALVC